MDSTASRITEIERLLTAADAAYHNGSDALMEDAAYDALRKELFILAPNHSLLTRVGAPAARDSILEKRHHTIPMGSLAKAMDREEWDAWVAKMAAAGHTRFTASLKMDGGSVSLEYRDGALVQAVTRGDGQIGEDITANALRFRDVPKTGVTLGAQPFTGFVRAEIMLTHDDWLRADPDQTSNPRNLGNGISRRKDGEQAELLTAYAFAGYDAHGCGVAATEKGVIDALRVMGFQTAGAETGDAAAMWRSFERTGTARAKLPYWIDGVVVKVDDIAAQRALGESSGCPRGQVAIKFPAAGAETELLDVELTVGHTGAIIPTGKLKPVQIGGTTVSSVLLCNWAIIEALGVAIGDTVEVVKAGDIVPRVIRVVKGGKNRRQIARPTACPSCGGTVSHVITTDGEQSVALYCRNDTDCPAQATGKIARFIASVGILGIGDEVLAAIVEQLGVRTAADLYTLGTGSNEDLANVQLSNGRLGESRADRIVAEIDKVSKLTLAQFLGSIGIEGLGKRRVQLIQAAVPGQLDTLDDWTSGKLEKLAEQAGVPNTGARISDDVDTALPLIEQFLANGVTIIAAAAPKPANAAAKSFCITGTLSRPREELIAAIEAAGHTFKSSVSKGLHYLVIADPASTSSKAVKARKLGTQCISEDQLTAILEGQA